MTDKAEKEVFVVTAGCYSDYHICGIFTKEDEAKEFKTLFVDANTKIEKWPLDPVAPGFFGGRKAFSITMMRNGDVRHARQADIDEYDDEPNIWGDVYYEVVLATDEQHAVKIVNEHRVQLIANGTWPEGVEKNWRWRGATRDLPYPVGGEVSR